MGRLNTRTLLNRLQALGMASRAELAKSLGMSQPTAGRIVDELLTLGVLEEISSQENPPPDAEAKGVTGRLGRPGRLLRLDNSKPRFLAIQLAVKKTSFALLPVGFKGKDQWAFDCPTATSERELATQLQSAADRLDQRDFWGILVSVPGVVDETSGQVVYSPNLHWTEQAKLPQLLAKVWKAPVMLVQEERALALGHHATVPDREDFILVDFGEGVGGSVVLEGRLCVTPSPVSGELGHIPVPGNRRKCGCGAIGCLETLVSTRGLLESFTQSSASGSAATWPRLVEQISREGIPPWLAEALDAAAMAIDGALNLMGLRRVVITGALSDMPPAVMNYLSEAILRGALWARFGQVDISCAPRRRLAGLVAAGIDNLICLTPT